MLILSRKATQQIVVADGITITVRRIAGNRVTLGVDAPREVSVRRGELPPRHKAGDGVAGEAA